MTKDAIWIRPSEAGTIFPPINSVKKALTLRQGWPPLQRPQRSRTLFPIKGIGLRPHLRTMITSPTHTNAFSSLRDLWRYSKSTGSIPRMVYFSNTICQIRVFSPLIRRQQRLHLLEHWVCTKQNLLICREGFGLSWALGVFISPLMAKLKNFRIILCAGAILMSSGLVLASFSTTVIATRTCCNANGSSHTCI